MALSASMLALAVYVQIDTRRDAWRQAEQASDNLLIALEQDIARNIMLLDLSMQGLLEALAEPDIDRASPGVRHHALFDRAASAEDLGSLLVLDANGTILEDSTAIVPHALNLGDRDYFRVQRENPEAGLFISRPFRSRLRAGDYSISFSRRIPTADGHFQGVVSCALRLTFFKHLFDRLNLGRTGNISLLRTDGRMVTRYPFVEADVDRDFSQAQVFKRLDSGPTGQFVGIGTTSGKARLYTYRRVRGLPLILAVNVSANQVLSAWRQKAWVTGIVLSVLCGATMALCLLFRRELLRRASAEQALELTAAKLGAMAATDGLTGVLNRRGFEDRFQVEWQRAIRSNVAIAVLMIDADHFKSYNDHHGHIEGDVVLRSIATCMEQSIRHPRDIVARFGGEEFVIVLPDAGGAESMRIAERVRAVVEALGIPHGGAALGLVTVSVGMAAARPVTGDLPALLIKAADEALYAAKRGGRNRVAAADISTPSYEPGAEAITRDL